MISNWTHNEKVSVLYKKSSSSWDYFHCYFRWLQFAYFFPLDPLGSLWLNFPVAPVETNVNSNGKTETQVPEAQA